MKTLVILVIVFTTIMLNGCSSRKTPAPVSDSKGYQPLNQRVKNTLKGKDYIVKKGETLYSIAWRADLDVRTLAKINNINAPYQILPGQKLHLVNELSTKSKQNVNKKKNIKNKHKIIKKPVAVSKNQEYRGNTTTKNLQKNTKNKEYFSQKIRRWHWPVKGRIIKKYSPINGRNSGINISGKKGSRVKSAANGKVVYAGDALQGYGKLVIIKHNQDYLSAYAHNDQILVKEQQHVKVGQVIAKMGNTDSEQVMLHFEIRFRGKSVNPLKYLPKK